MNQRNRTSRATVASASNAVGILLQSKPSTTFIDTMTN